MLIWVAIIMMYNASAQQLSSLTVSKPVQKEWVVVLNDPRPGRLQGWQNPRYRGNQHYASSLELARFGKRVAKRHDLSLKQEWFIESLSVYCLIVQFNGDESDTLVQLQQDDRVQWVQPSNEFELLGKDKVAMPNTTSSAEFALPSSIDGNGVLIAMIDSAVDTTHPDISTAIQGTADFVISGTQTSIGEAHGTAMAGVLVAKPDSKLGVVGVAPGADLVAYRGCWEELAGNTQCNTLSLARALDAVVNNNDKPMILNLSLSGPHDRLLESIMAKVISNGTITVAAFDPMRPHAKRFPSPRKGVLIVRAETLDKQYQDQFTAPGGRIVTSPGNRYDYMMGHSVASAYTAGVLALIAQSPQRHRLKMLFDSSGKTKYRAVSDLLETVLSRSSEPTKAEQVSW